MWKELSLSLYPLLREFGKMGTTIFWKEPFKNIFLLVLGLEVGFYLLVIESIGVGSRKNRKIRIISQNKDQKVGNSALVLFYLFSIFLFSTCTSVGLTLLNLSHFYSIVFVNVGHFDLFSFYFQVFPPFFSYFSFSKGWTIYFFFFWLFVALP